MAVMALNPRQRKFIVEYLIDFNGTKAAIRAGYTSERADQAAYQLLSNSEIMAAIDDKIQEQLDLAELSVQWVLRQWKQIAEANPGELTWTEIECCRHCYGVNHLYQWTQVEFQIALQAAQSHICSKRCERGCVNRMPDGAGGFDFNPRRVPVEDCPVCNGRGYERVRICDTRHLKGSARRLYAGVKQTKDGIEIKMRDQDGALSNISKYFGMLIDRKELSAPGGGPIQVQQFTAEDLTTDQIAQLMKQRGLIPDQVEVN